MSKIEPIFDFEVQDWEYHAIVTGTGLMPDGMVDVLGLIYKDDLWKIKGRVLFPSGNKMCFSNKFESYEEAFKMVTGLLDQLPDIQDVQSNIIYNTTTKGTDLFEAMKSSQHMEITYREIHR